MATPTLTPTSRTSAVVLPATGTVGTTADAAGNTSHYPFGIYSDTVADLYDANFVTGASDQVAYTYKKLGGDILDVELTVGNIYAAYEEATLEYSYIVNVHQAKNILHSSLGASTGTFDHDGQLSGSNQPPSDVALRYPKYKFGYSKKLMNHASTEVGIGGTVPIYSASFETSASTQDYDLQTIVSSSAATDADMPYYNKVGGKRITIRRVFYKTPHAMWRFYGYYGGMNTVGNMSTYGMYADDSTYEVIPPWHNKAQAMAYEDAIYTRNSHYSYEIKDNNLRMYPVNTSVTPLKMWVYFSVEDDPWDEQDERPDGVMGVNNMNTLPLTNLPFKNINSVGKQWVRRFALALSKETLGQVRSKFGQIPIPGNSVTLNGDKLISESREEQKMLREELQKVLDELTYEKITEIQKNMVKNTQEAAAAYPYFIYVG
tara:strand:- start:9192 stop:10487 length:1296 start_codon:yes stop_codon:yes gene_type:complete